MATLNTIIEMIETDEGNQIPCEIDYMYRSRLLSSDQIADVQFKIKGHTETPEYVLREQVYDIIRAYHGAAEFV